jgi:hypothetical protein
MKVGEPLTRTLTLRGVGTTVGQLPELNTVKTDANVKAYPDQPVLNEQKQADGISASRQEKIALIPAMAGKHILPAIEIPWFNTKSQSVEVARIPETTINVIGSSETQQPNPVPPKPVASPSAPVSKPNINNPVLVSIDVEGKNIWPWVSVFLACGWLVTIILFWHKRTKKPVADTKATERLLHETSLKESVKKLKEACADDDAHAAKNALLAWGKQKFNATNLGAIATYCDARLRDEILHLNQVLYGKDASQWDGKNLMQAFTGNKARNKIANTEESVLEPLHRL